MLERGEPRDVLVADLVARGAELGDRGVDVPRRPERHRYRLPSDVFNSATRSPGSAGSALRAALATVAVALIPKADTLGDSKAM
ncbi:hypothetical protein ACFRQM_36745 [Streptomyces sp. NPDC056831]|uniref:hypothetical protein n=1 Tax=Streptomyces sp. NPDC056831 TaxID=3345954 RepID=UPI00367B549E